MTEISMTVGEYLRKAGIDCLSSCKLSPLHHRIGAHLRSDGCSRHQRKRAHLIIDGLNHARDAAVGLGPDEALR
jgi:hypothetical protein